MFHRRGPAAAKLLTPRLVRFRGTTNGLVIGSVTWSGYLTCIIINIYMYAMTVTLHIEFWKLHGNLGYRKKLSTNLLVIVRNIAVQVLCLRRCGRISSCTTAISRTLSCRNAASWVHRSPCAPVPSPAIQRWTHVKHTRPVVKLEVVVCESVQEPPGQVLAKIWAFKAWLNQPITGQVQVQVQVGLWNFLNFIISWNFPEISGNFRKISENISKAWKLKRL